MKCLVVNDSGTSYYRPFEHLGLNYSSNHNVIFDNPEKVALVVFTGGEDVTPSLYGDRTHRTTHYNMSRDTEELEIFRQANKHEIPMAGICRGAQFLCVMAGGKLIQNIYGHAGQHHRLAYRDENGNVKISDGVVTSSHHQMQWPRGNFKLLAWSPSRISSTYEIGGGISVEDPTVLMEPDCVLYPDIKALGIQFHPEWMSDDSWGFNFAKGLISKYVGEYIKASV